MAIDLIHHVQFFVSNAIQASYWFCTVFGFKRFAEKRDETTLSIAVRNGKAVLVFTSPNSPKDARITQQIAEHGDFVGNVAYQVDDLDKFLKESEASITIIAPKIAVQDENGTTTTATIQGSAPGIVHELYQLDHYTGCFLPGYVPSDGDVQLFEELPRVAISHVDHVVEAHGAGGADPAAEWLGRALRLHRFWSIDDAVVHTDYSALRAALVANASRAVQVALVEPAPTARRGRGQVQEFLDFHGGPGIQHVAFAVDDIIGTVAEMRRRGVEFLHIPDAYYNAVKERLRASDLEVAEDFEMIRRNRLLIDFDERGYLLQCFTRPIQPRPTFFVEIIRRNNFDGFGAGNFKALFEAVELEQKRRGTLFMDQ